MQCICLLTLESCGFLFFLEAATELSVGQCFEEDPKNEDQKWLEGFAFKWVGDNKKIW